mgnify:CR=1 FL=1
MPGSFQSELGCASDWDPSCGATALAFNAGRGTWERPFQLAAGQWQFRVTVGPSWFFNLGTGGLSNGSNYVINVASPRTALLTYEHHSRTAKVVLRPPAPAAVFG